MRAFAELPSNVWCVGGSPDAIAPPGDFSRTLHAALFRNPMGLGPADYRSSERVRPVQSVYLGAWRPGVLQTLGGFDPGWQANEDAELAERIRRAGGIVYRVPARCSKLITRSASAAVKQWTRYGFWRAQTFKRNPSAMRLRHVAPPVVLLALAALAASPVWWAIGPIAFAHACAVIAYRPRHQTLAITFASVLYFPIVHVGYALGLIAGALIPQRKATKPAAAGMFSGIRGPLTATDPESP
ncbi:MAG: hypothetical protein GIW95_00170 [Candidatus Eremiobacteraeota bacterium]|nr:hypothetical protein [Candidatus Eremiobacteraeota bacterium]